MELWCRFHCRLLSLSRSETSSYRYLTSSSHRVANNCFQYYSPTYIDSVALTHRAASTIRIHQERSTRFLLIPWLMFLRDTTSPINVSWTSSVSSELCSLMSVATTLTRVSKALPPDRVLRETLDRIRRHDSEHLSSQRLILSRQKRIDFDERIFVYIFNLMFFFLPFDFWSLVIKKLSFVSFIMSSRIFDYV